ncbi:MAG: fumarylacetoacetase [Roseococcus sp.]|nr:fumarylacetoacetase [Roseococcus sp.]
MSRAPVTDATQDPALRSWVESANGHPDFPIQNLPLGVFSPPGGAPRAGVAIGEMVLDLAAAGLALPVPLNAFLAEGAAARRVLRARVSALLAQGATPHPEWLHPQREVTLHLPVRIGDYTDFYAGIHHAVAAGRLFRPDNPLLPNYKHLPVGYHGRASSVVPSGTPIRRPNGQRAGAEGPSFGPSQRLDYELELGLFIGPGNALGEPVPISRAAEHIAGFCLLNDWSARDIQGWEYQPLGPFLGKSFATTISPWIVTPEALAPFRLPQAPRPEGDPRPLPYLWDEADQAGGALDLELEVWLHTPGLRARGLPPHRVAASHARHLYYTPAQLVAHHTSNGCNLQPGDLLGTGTISGPERAAYGSLLETTAAGREPLRLASGETRAFLEDGDEVVLTARARREGAVPIGFGPCAGVVLPAP